ncbi:MAG: hypothetical protein OIF36_01275 [Alphaproteobacteria bacterium]|jgi:hypothetical protein|nr:hypothetical protein [Alphaproteobacteria bacterium]MCV6599101.1 hypothetical protein [Alphaproteobacteria bacterium]
MSNKYKAEFEKESYKKAKARILISMMASEKKGYKNSVSMLYSEIMGEEFRYDRHILKQALKSANLIEIVDVMSHMPKDFAEKIENRDLMFFAIERANDKGVDMVDVAKSLPAGVIADKRIRSEIEVKGYQQIKETGGSLDDFRDFIEDIKYIEYQKLHNNNVKIKTLSGKVIPRGKLLSII